MITKRNFKKNIGRGLALFMWLLLGTTLIKFFTNLYYVDKITPVMQEIPTLSLILFFNSYYLNIIALVLEIGFLLHLYRR